MTRANAGRRRAIKDRPPLKVQDNVPPGARVVLTPRALKAFGILMGPDAIERLKKIKKEQSR